MQKRGPGHRFPEIEDTGLRIGGEGSQAPSPRRVRAEVTGVSSIELSK